MSFSASGFSEERGVAPEAHVESPRLWRYPAQKRFISAISTGTGQRDDPLGRRGPGGKPGLGLWIQRDRPVRHRGIS